jgi:hypothetical protein
VVSFLCLLLSSIKLKPEITCKPKTPQVNRMRSQRFSLFLTWEMFNNISKCQTNKEKAPFHFSFPLFSFLPTEAILTKDKWFGNEISVTQQYLKLWKKVNLWQRRPDIKIVRRTTLFTLSLSLPSHSFTSDVDITSKSA